MRKYCKFSWLPLSGKPITMNWKLVISKINKRNSIVITCVLCDEFVESLTYLFLHCLVASKVWRMIMSSLGINFIIPHNLFVHLECWRGEIVDKKLKKGFMLIWHATIWVMWKTRKERIFKNVVKEVGEMVEDIKLLWWNCNYFVYGVVSGSLLFLRCLVFRFIYSVIFVLCFQLWLVPRIRSML